jgi:hypothetical protein
MFISIVMIVLIFLTESSIVILLNSDGSAYAQRIQASQDQNFSNSTASDKKIISQILTQNHTIALIPHSITQPKEKQQLPRFSESSSLAIIDSLTERNLSSTLSPRLSLNRTYYTFSPDRHEISTPQH